jgi:hypothetical protein
MFFEVLREACGRVAPVGGRIAGVGCNVSLVGICKQFLLSLIADRQRLLTRAYSCLANLKSDFPLVVRTAVLVVVLTRPCSATVLLHGRPP